MSLVELRVELPSYSRTFVVLVAPSANIGDVKDEIAKTCVGAPRPDGQRLIWRGRSLRNTELIQELWKTPEEPKIVHLAVHPSAWTSAPPGIPPTATSPVSPPAPLSFTPSSPAQPLVPHYTRLAPQHTHLSHIIFQHESALACLRTGRKPPLTDPFPAQVSRSLSVAAVEAHGWIWPSILDEPYPAEERAGGLIYEQLTANGQSYLKLVNPDATPTSQQIHALKVLTYTFPLLSLPGPSPAVTRVTPSQQVPIPPQVNQLLQQLGLPQLRAGPNQNAVQDPVLPEVRDLPLRPLMVPLVMLIIRTMLLLYFVAPARKPVFGLLILAWMTYEAWRAIRDGILQGFRRNEDRQQRQNAPGAAAGNAAQPGQPVVAPEQQPHGRPANELETQARAILDTIGRMDIEREEAILSNPAAHPSEPGLLRKAWIFVALMVTTIHPAAWNSRRVALRQREGRIRTEANAREAPVSAGENESAYERQVEIRNHLIAQHVRRPRWIQAYIERVRGGDWVDDSD